MKCHQLVQCIALLTPARAHTTHHTTSHHNTSSHHTKAIKFSRFLCLGLLVLVMSRSTAYVTTATHHGENTGLVERSWVSSSRHGTPPEVAARSSCERSRCCQWQRQRRLMDLPPQKGRFCHTCDGRHSGLGAPGSWPTDLG